MQRVIDDLDNPKTTIERISILSKNKYLKRLYTDFYKIFLSNSKNLPHGKKVELGSGAGFIKELIPDCLTSDIMKLPNCDMTFSAEKMPFPNSSLSAIYMLNVFHHIKNPKKALHEFHRCLKVGGKIIMIEPFNTFWSSFIYKNFHYEDFDENGGWIIKKKGDLSSANNALPWIVFVRDQDKFSRFFPNLKIIGINPHTPFQFLISGGFSRNPFLPVKLYNFVSLIEKRLYFLRNYLGMFATIVLEKTG